PVITPEDSDGNVSGAHNSVVEGTNDTVTGSVTVSAEAGIASVTVGGKDVTGASAANPGRHHHRQGHPDRHRLQRRHRHHLLLLPGDGRRR
ncbi:hypothetical protein, partial [Achromobacter insolitus]|uniref:hypothetical protein n=1 Tax=Achromobacter insolitus TaxID=217204 RepID=UPI003BA0B812